MYIEKLNGKIISVADWQFPNSEYTEKEVVRGNDGAFYFKGEEPVLADTRSYAEKRLAAYPDIAEFLDAQVKINSDNALLVAEGKLQLTQYYQNCLNVKQTFPKDNI